jgi:hypothetical protein
VATDAGARGRSSIVVPDRWERIDAGGPGPFVTRETYVRADGTIVTWTSRSQRKQRSLLDGHRGSTWWAPTAVGWWIGVLFAIGSLCFALGSAPRYVDRRILTGRRDARATPDRRFFVRHSGWRG